MFIRYGNHIVINNKSNHSSWYKYKSLGYEFIFNHPRKRPYYKYNWKTFIDKLNLEY